MIHRFGKDFIYAIIVAAFGLSVASAAANFTLHGYDSKSAFVTRSLVYKDAESTHEDGTEVIRRVHANTTGTPSFSAGTLRLPESDVHRYVTVQNTHDARRSVARILVYGHTVLVNNVGNLSASFYAEETDAAGVWHLVWEPNNNDASDLERVILRNR